MSVVTPSIAENEGTSRGTLRVLREIAERTFLIRKAIAEELERFLEFYELYFPKKTFPNIDVGCQIRILEVISCDGKGLSFTKEQISLLLSDLEEQINALCDCSDGDAEELEKLRFMRDFIANVNVVGSAFHYAQKVLTRVYSTHLEAGEYSMIEIAKRLKLYQNLPPKKLSIEWHDKMHDLCRVWLEGVLLSMFGSYLHVSLSKTKEDITTEGRLRNYASMNKLLKCYFGLASMWYLAFSVSTLRTTFARNFLLSSGRRQNKGLFFFFFFFFF